MPVIMPKIRNMGAVGINVHYGAEAPADTSKLWVKTDTTPSSLTASPRDLEMTEGDRITCGATMPTKGGYSVAAAAVGTKVYLFGGYMGGLSDAIYRYDAETDELVALDTKLPQALGYIGAAVVGVKVYLFGGSYSGDYNGVTTIQVYDTEADTLTTLATELPEKTLSISTVVEGAKVYLIGGRSAAFLTTIRVYDTETDTITTKAAELPEKAIWHSVAKVGTKVYILGGRASSAGAERYRVRVYDIETDTLTTLDLVSPYDLHGATNSTVAIGQKIYLYGTGSNGNADRIIFDTESYEITRQADFFPRDWKYLAAAIVNVGESTRVYVFTGWYPSYTAYCSDAIYYSEFGTVLAAGTAYMKTAPSKNLFPFISGDTTLTIGVDSVYIGDAGEKAASQEAYLYDETTSEWKLIE